MTADHGFECVPAAPAPPPQEASNQTQVIERVSDGSSKGWKIFFLLMIFALIAGVTFTFAVKRSGGAVSASAEVATGSGAAVQEAVAATSTAAPADCAGIEDPTQKWYCEEVRPAFVIAAADHKRIDRLEADKGSGDSKVPLALWLVLAFIGILTVYNTVLIHSKKPSPPAAKGDSQ